MYIKGRVFIFCSLFWTATYPTQWHDTLHSLFKGVCSELSENVTQITNAFCLFLYITDIKLVHFCCWNCDISHVTDAQMLSKNVIPVDSSRSYEVVRTEKCSKIHSSVTFFSTNVQLLFDPISQQHLSMWTWLRWPAEVHIEHQNIEESCFKMLPYSQGFSQQVAPYVLSWQISFLCQISPKEFLSLPRIKRRICYSGEFVNHYTTEPPTSEQVALNVAYLLEPDVTRIFFKWTSVRFTENGWKMRKYQVCSSSIDENAFLLPHARDKWSDWKRAVIQNHSLKSTKVCMKHLWLCNRPHIEADGIPQQPKRCATELPCYPVWHNPHWSLTENGKLRLPFPPKLDHRGQTLPGLMSFGSCCYIHVVESQFGVNNMKGWTHGSILTYINTVV